jgi:hypothetical protein
MAFQKRKLLTDIIPLRRKEELFKLLEILKLDIYIFHIRKSKIEFRRQHYFLRRMSQNDMYSVKHVTSKGIIDLTSMNADARYPMPETPGQQARTAPPKFQGNLLCYYPYTCR